MRLRAGYASHAVTVHDIEVVAIRNTSVNALRVDQVKLTWTTFRIQYLHQHNTGTGVLQIQPQQQ